MLAGVSNYVGANHNISFQWSMLYEPHAMHPVGPGMAGNPIGCPTAPPDPSVGNPCFEAQEVQVDYHHSVFVNLSHRIPENANKSSAWISNIVYNWDFYANEWLGASTIDVVNNIFKPGNLNSQAQTFPIHFSGNGSSELPDGTPSDYVSGNICRGDSNIASDQWGRCTQQITGENGSEIGPVPDNWKRATPDPRDFPITPDSATSLDNALLPTVGNSQHLDCDGIWVSHRDAADIRVLNQYKTSGSGGFWPNAITQAGPSSVPPPNSDYQDHPVTGFSACTESMHDGIPDQWKVLKGLSTTDPNLHNATAPNGYTWLENYLDGQ
jgi:pectate lyase